MVNQNTPAEWGHPVLPSPAVQGMVLMTKTDFATPPSEASQFMWKLMEDVFGVHNIKLEWDSATNIYTVKASAGHLNNDGTWVESWRTIGTITGLSTEAEEKIRQLTYASYRYDTSVANALKVYGVKLDATEVLLCDITFANASYVDGITGNKANLQTTDKSNLVAAINELVGRLANVERITFQGASSSEDVDLVRG